MRHSPAEQTAISTERLAPGARANSGAPKETRAPSASAGTLSSNVSQPARSAPVSGQSDLAARREPAVPVAAGHVEREALPVLRHDQAVHR